MRETLVRVVAPHFVAGFVVRDGRCVEAAPILRRHLMGRTVEEARAIIAGKGWRAHIVRTGDEPGEEA